MQGSKKPCFPDDGIQGFLFGEKVKTGKSNKVWFPLIATLFFLLLSCSNRPAENANSATGRGTTLSAVVPMRVVTDDLDRQLTIPVNITRVISLAPSVTESVFAVGAGDRLVGDTTYCNYPEEAKTIQKVGDTLNPNMETIVALKPDVVFVSGASQLETFTSTLDRNGIAVYVMDPQSLDDVLTSLSRLADILGTQDAGKTLTDSFSARRVETGDKIGANLAEEPNRETQEKSVGIKTVFVQISREPLFTIGKTSFLNQLIYEAGGKSVTADVDTAFPKLSKETALALNPDVIILSDSPDNQEPNEVFSNSPAVKDKRIYKINADIISRPGPRLIDALEQIAKDLHPEKFE